MVQGCCLYFSGDYRKRSQVKGQTIQNRTSSRPAWTIYLESVSKENVKKKKERKVTWDIAQLVSAGEASVKPGITAPVLKNEPTKTP